ncbi:hypothetical protein [Zavarzinella formosa]|uniref:hypothetical protein n=1 Tax=Zavarzinella formosa TaxID=360055 RepID=UPI0002E02E40|nr:hypothetical protein [Zavarzinella formosa]
MTTASSFWWSLPGPSRFIEAVAGSLNDGRSVVVPTPRIRPPQFNDAIRRACDPAGSFQWFEFTWRGEKTSPANWLARQLLKDSPSVHVDGRILALSNELPSGILWIHGLTMEHWLAWKDFLKSYAAGCLARPAHDRMAIIAPVAGLNPSSQGVTDVSLAVVPWMGWVGSHDQLSYIAWQTRDRGRRTVIDEVSIAIAAELSGFDPGLAEVLSTLPLEKLINPISTLCEYSQDFEWTTFPTSQFEQWENGMVHYTDASLTIHSGVLAMKGDQTSKDELTHRIWRAQVSVLLPFVEMRRRALVEHYMSVLIPPFRLLSGDVVDRVFDLEIGQLEWELTRQQQPVPRCVSILKQIRNRLAHLKIVPAELIRNPAISMV